MDDDWMLIVLVALVVAIAVGALAWDSGRSDIAKDCEAHGVFIRGKTAFVCSPVPARRDGL